MKKTLLIFCTFYILILSFSIFNCNAQMHNQSDDTLQIKRHSPKKASWLALIPGAGQIYNKKYWKLPIVYGGMGASGFLVYYFADQTSVYNKEIRARLNEDYENLNPIFEEKSDASILDSRNYYRKNMEISIAAFVIVYFLSILDATVDAHLYYYDVSDNLSLGVKPKIDFNPVNRTPMPSLALVIKF